MPINEQLAQRFETAPRFLQAQFEPSDRIAIVLIYRDDRGVKHEFMSAARAADPAVQAHLRAANAHGANLYVSVNALNDDARARTKADVKKVRHVYLDIDKRGPEIVAEIERSDLPRPSVVLETSPGKRQILWRVKDFEKDQAEGLVRSIAQRFDADESVWDCARVLRIPGFANHKPTLAKPFFVRVLPGERSTQILVPGDFPATPKLDRPLHVTRGATPANGATGNSQSERDWAYCLRSLKRGESPTNIAAAIEAYRRDDKPSPHQYAIRTVENAQRALQQKRGVSNGRKF